jgi:nitrite reductase/ring-hydroxylating ferredoxin subunit
MNSGGHATVSANGYSDPNCGSGNIIVVQVGSGQYVAFSSACPHACCDVSVSGGIFKCPCHGAQFDLMTGQSAGIRTNQPLPQLMVCADANGVTVSW